MRHVIPDIRRPAAAPILALLAALPLAAPRAPAQGYVYTLSDQGRVFVNALVIEDLPGNANQASPDSAGSDNIWSEMVVDGAGRYALRFDGLAYLSGEKIGKSVDGGAIWRSLLVIDGAVHALRTNGRLEIDGELYHHHTDGDFAFWDLAQEGGDLFALRTDGRVFRNEEDVSIIRFRGDAPGDGADGGSGEGESVRKTWRMAAFHPVDGTLHALRQDGTIAAADPDVVPVDAGETEWIEGAVVAKLPFGDDATPDKRYFDLAFFDDGVWLALRGNGEVYRSDDPAVPLADLPGNAQSDSTTYVDLLEIGDSVGGRYLVLRRDGRIHVDGSADHVVDLWDKGYREMVFATEPPDLTNTFDREPVATRFDVKVQAGGAVALPVLAVDPETASDALLVTVDESTVPPGATWDDETRTLSWSRAGPIGKYALKFTVDDGTHKTKSKLKIGVVGPDGNPAKNKAPQLAKVKQATALQGVPYELPIVAFDADGDALSISVDEASYPYTSGATFDPKDATFRWTPTVADLGKIKLTFVVGDGTVTVKRKLALQVVASLHAL